MNIPVINIIIDIITIEIMIISLLLLILLSLILLLFCSSLFGELLFFSSLELFGHWLEEKNQINLESISKINLYFFKKGYPNFQSARKALSKAINR